jgi:hypothetical protein
MRSKFGEANIVRGRGFSTQERFIRGKNHRPAACTAAGLHAM